MSIDFLSSHNTSAKGLVLGADAQNLRKIYQLLPRLFPKMLCYAVMIRGLHTKKLQTSAVKKVDHCVVFFLIKVVDCCDIALFIEAVLRYMCISI